MLDKLIAFASAHKEAIIVAAGWATHVFWPNLKQAYPYLRDNGGVVGLVKNVFVGKIQPKP